MLDIRNRGAWNLLHYVGVVCAVVVAGIAWFILTTGGTILICVSVVSVIVGGLLYKVQIYFDHLKEEMETLKNQPKWNAIQHIEEMYNTNMENMHAMISKAKQIIDKCTLLRASYFQQDIQIFVDIVQEKMRSYAQLIKDSKNRIWNNQGVEQEQMRIIQDKMVNETVFPQMDIWLSKKDLEIEAIKTILHQCMETDRFASVDDFAKAQENGNAPIITVMTFTFRRGNDSYLKSLRNNVNQHSKEKTNHWLDDDNLQSIIKKIKEFNSLFELNREIRIEWLILEGLSDCPNIFDVQIVLHSTEASNSSSYPIRGIEMETDVKSPSEILVSVKIPNDTFCDDFILEWSSDSSRKTMQLSSKVDEIMLCPLAAATKYCISLIGKRRSATLHRIVERVETFQTEPPIEFSVKTIFKNRLILEWKSPVNPPIFEGKRLLDMYVVHMYLGNEYVRKMHTSEPHVEVTSLCINTTYAFNVKAVYQNNKTSGFTPMLSCRTLTIEEARKRTPHALLAEYLRKKSKCLTPNDSLKIYKLALNMEGIDHQSKTRKFSLGNLSDTSYGNEKVIMIVGMTGAGKSTLINGMINYVLGVEWDDDFRFKLIVEDEEIEERGGTQVTDDSQQAKSMTNWISSYTLNHQHGFRIPYSLTIIDTPGFGDTSGLKRDQEIVNQISSFFNNQETCSMQIMHCIGLVAQAALARLTATQRYVFESVLSIFGKDVQDNFVLMITFADAQPPPVLAAIKAAEIQTNESHFKFNNSAIYASKNEENTQNLNFNQMFWEMGFESFEHFFEELKKADAKSLSLTREVLGERETLMVCLESIQPQIGLCLNQLADIGQHFHMIKNIDINVAANRNYRQPVRVPIIERVRITDGEFITNCVGCSFTCHFPCSISSSEHKSRCAAMTNGKCCVCPKKCDWTQHVNDTYQIVHTYVTEERTVQNILDMYTKAKSEKITKKDFLLYLLDSYTDRKDMAYELANDARACANRLSEIALRPNHLSDIQYLELLIQGEKQLQHAGYIERIDQLQHVIIRAKTLRRIEAGDNIIEEEHDSLVRQVLEYIETQCSDEEGTQINDNQPMSTEAEDKKFLNRVWDKVKGTFYGKKGNTRDNPRHTKKKKVPTATLR